MTGWCKLYCADSMNMKEVEDETVQMAITSFPQEIISTVDGKPLHFGKVQREKAIEAMRRFGTAKGLTHVFTEYAPSLIPEVAKEVSRVLTKDGVFINNVGCPAVGCMTWDLFQHFYPSAIPLYPYTMVEKILADTKFHLLFDFILDCLPAIVEDKATKMKKLAVIQGRLHKGIFLNVDHFFVFGKTEEIKMNVKEVPSPMDPTIWVPLVFHGTPPPPLKRGQDAVLTPFSEDILKTFITLFTDEGDIVLDPCAGTGTVGKVAIQLNRNAILYEIEPKLIPVIEEKIKPYIGRGGR